MAPITLWCYLEGSKDVFPVDLDDEKAVYYLKKAIYAEIGPRLGGIPPTELDVWQIQDSEDVAMNRASADFNVADCVRHHRPISAYWTGLDPDYIHVFIADPFLKKRKLSSIDDPFDEDAVFKKHRAAQDSLVRAVRADKAPSSQAAPSGFQELQNGKHPILNGRNGHYGPPLGIFQEIFDKFKALAHTSEPPSLTDLDRFLEFEKASNRVYEDEKMRINGTLSLLGVLLGEQPIQELSGGGARADFVWKAAQGEDKKVVYTVFGEVKNEAGTGKGDGGVQGLLTYRKMCAAHYDEAVRKASNCPAFILTLTGPYFSIQGAIFTDYCISEMLTPGLMHLGPKLRDQNIKYFVALRKCLHELSEFYRQCPLGENPSRMLPRGLTLDHPLGALAYRERISRHGLQKVMYRAKLGNKPVVVKFVERYGTQAHKLLESKGLAPALLYFSDDTYGGLHLVIMDFVEGMDASERWHGKRIPKEELVQKIESALKILHENDQVFGDLRKPNIMITELDGKLHPLLVDFDWAGARGKVCYPVDLNTKLPWAAGVKRCGPIQKEHDVAMLEKLRHDDPES